jgi:phytol kinase
MKVRSKLKERLSSASRSRTASGSILAGGLGRIDRRSSPSARRLPQQGLLHAIASRLGPHEVRRRLAHMAPGLLPLLMMVIPHRDPVSPTLMAIMISTTVVISGWIWIRHSRIVRLGEKSIVGAVLGYGGVVLSMLVLMPERPELGMTVMGILAFGDGSATLVGLAAGGRRLPWNRQKSWTGMLAFLVAALPLATLILWGESQPGIPIALALACAAPATLIGALAESLPMRLNDNIRVGVAAAMTITAAHAMFVGW